MARGGRISFSVDSKAVVRNLQASIERVERGTKKATRAAVEEIMEHSLEQVPEKTGTLARSAFYEIHGRYRNFSATFGYGGNGDPENPVTGQRASEYMLAVHEDLEARHSKGKAKYLEDPLREYQQKFLPGAAKHLRAALK